MEEIPMSILRPLDVRLYPITAYHRGAISGRMPYILTRGMRRVRANPTLKTLKKLERIFGKELVMV
ncbi:hypothetical protein FACS1894164_12130 [Spirochaetia bacterium]|nr:hypothetical protein FACS1894164_12130 [Spirochaetia bacterium]